ncbi:MAG: 50S ribosomal protein L29 [Minisyncoccota bacterium]
MKDFKNKTEKELKVMLADKRVALRNFRFSVAGSKVKNVKEGYVVRKDIARILTAISAMK